MELGVCRSCASSSVNWPDQPSGRFGLLVPLCHKGLPEPRGHPLDHRTSDQNEAIKGRSRQSTIRPRSRLTALMPAGRGRPRALAVKGITSPCVADASPIPTRAAPDPLSPTGLRRDFSPGIVWTFGLKRQIIRALRGTARDLVHQGGGRPHRPLHPRACRPAQ